jgi:hypothetical protein
MWIFEHVNLQEQLLELVFPVRLRYVFEDIVMRKCRGSCLDIEKEGKEGKERKKYLGHSLHGDYVGGEKHPMSGQ